MCPGGFVVPAASGPEQVVVNGMSPAARNSQWANSGMVVEIHPEDMEALSAGKEMHLTKEQLSSPLAGIIFQENLERLCWINGGMKQTAPAQRMTDFINLHNSSSLSHSSYTPGLITSPLHNWLPTFISERLREGLKFFGRASHGFLTNEASMIGVETRTSSPVRILRDQETCRHIEMRGLFP